MIHKLAIIDDFLDDPQSARKTIIETPMEDTKGPDGVVYPGIVLLSDAMEKYVSFMFEDLYSGRFKKKLIFARHSYADMNPPNWAHSDYELAQYVGLIYLSPIDYPNDGTYLVRHRDTGLETHPENDDDIKTLLTFGNFRTQWDITMTIPSKFNRLLVLNTKYLHAAADKFGNNRENSRLVLSVFFDLD